MNIFSRLIIELYFCVLTDKASAATCTGRFVNPITDICWDCAFPPTIGSATLISGAGGAVQDTANPSSPTIYFPDFPPALSTHWPDGWFLGACAPNGYEPQAVMF